MVIESEQHVFAEKYDAFLQEFAKGKTMVLSTSENDRVTSRMMSIVQHAGRFYFQTDKTFRKYRQLAINPQVALCIDNISIEGICEELGHPMENPSFCALYQKCFGSSYKKYSGLTNERLFAISPTYVERWVYMDGVPFLETFDIKNQMYQLSKYKGI